jgi:hypothetical protein
MGPLAIILGSAIKDAEPGQIRLVTPGGDVLSIHEKDVLYAFNVDASGDLKRYALPLHATVSLALQAGTLRGVDFSSPTWVDRRRIMSADKDQDDGPIKIPPGAWLSAML